MTIIDRTPAGLQFVLPGAEKVGDAAMARRRAAEPLRPRVPQQPCDHGLFGDGALQTDLIAMASGRHEQARR
jgi:hypothetical protein